MSTLTPNYGLLKPDPDVDFALVDDINDNYDIIDATLKPLDDEATAQSGEEYGLNIIELDIEPNEIRVVSAGQWGSIFGITQSTPIDEVTKWILDIQFTGDTNTGAEPTSLSVRVDRGINQGGTALLQTEIHGDDTVNESTSREAAVASRYITFTGLPTPYQDGVQTKYYMRFACSGETPNGHLLSFEVSPQGEAAEFYDVIARLILRP